MKKLIGLSGFYFAFLLPIFSYSQHSEIKNQGNSNIIKVYQVQTIHVYDLTRNIDVQNFLQYIQATFPKEVKELNRKTDKILSILSKSKEDELFSPARFTEELEKYILANQKLVLENEQLKKEATDPDFRLALEEGEKKLRDFDNAGYQNVLQNFKVSKIARVNKLKAEVGQASFLQSKNSLANYEISQAFDQIKEALQSEENNDEYLYLKGEILFNLELYRDADISLRNVLNLSKNDTIIAQTYGILSEISIIKKDLDGARFLLNKYASESLKIFGNGSIMASSINNSLGTLFEKANNYDSALYYYFKDLNYLKSRFGLMNYQTAILYNNIGLAYSHKGDFDKALNYLDTTLMIRTALFGPEHPNTSTVYHNLSEVYLDMKEFKLANIFENRALVISERTLGKYSMRTALNVNYIGLIYGKQNNFDSALFFHKLAYEIQDSLLANDDPSLIKTYTYLSKCYLQKSDYSQAIEYLNKAIRIRTNFYSPMEVELRTLQFQKGIALILQQGPTNIFDYYDSLKMDSSDLALNLNFSAQEFYQGSKLKECILLLSVATEVLERNNVSKKQTIWSLIYYNLAIAYCYNLQPEKSRNYFEKAINSLHDSGYNDSEIDIYFSNMQKCQSIMLNRKDTYGSKEKNN